MSNESSSDDSVEDALNEIVAPVDDIVDETDIVDEVDEPAEADDDDYMHMVDAGQAPSGTSAIKIIIVVKPENYCTSDVMSLFEMTENNSMRATQISQTGQCMVDTTGLTTSLDMAKRELMMRRSPLTVRRHVGDLANDKGEVESYYEVRTPNDMIFSTVYEDVM